MSGTIEEEYEYDAFISYHEKDAEWVADAVIRVLEEEDIKVCWDSRDFEPGRKILENKLNAICSSATIVVILSPDYARDESIWTEMNARCGWENEEIIKEFYIIPVIFKTCAVPDIFEPLWMLDWTNMATRKFFWSKLVQSIKKQQNRKCKHNVLSRIRSLNSINEFNRITMQAEDACKSSKSNLKGCSEEKVEVKVRTFGKSTSEMHKNYNDLKSKHGIGSKNSHCAENDNEKLIKNDKGREYHHDDLRGRQDEKKIVTNILQASVSEALNTAESVSGMTVGADTDSKYLANNNGDDDDKNEENRTRLIESMSPRILSFLVPEDDDLSRKDVEELTLKIEDVFATEAKTEHRMLVTNALYQSEEERDEEYKASNDSSTRKRKPKQQTSSEQFSSSQEQMHYLDTLQENEMKIKQKFQSCCNLERKKVYRRILERFDRAIFSTVNGTKDVELLSNLPISDQPFDETGSCRCPYCECLFHSDRALNIHVRYRRMCMDTRHETRDERLVVNRDCNSFFKIMDFSTPRHDLVEIKVQPMYLSTDLVTPLKQHRTTLPFIGVESKSEGGRILPWGNESFNCPRHKITYSHFNPSRMSDASVDLTHRHHGSRVVQMEAVRQPYDVTSLRLSNCRFYDQRLPSFNNDLIPKSKIVEPAGLTATNPYFVLTSKFQVFPMSTPQDTHCDKKETNALSKNTCEAICDANKAVYHTTTYMKDFPESNNKAVLKSLLKSSTAKHDREKRVNFKNDVQYLEPNETGEKNGEKQDEEQVVFDVSKEVTPASRASTYDPSRDESGVNSICRFCGKRKRHAVVLRFMDKDGRITYGSNSYVARAVSRESSLNLHHKDRSIGLANTRENSLSLPRIIANDCNNRSRGTRRYFCQCPEKQPQPKESKLKSEALLKRRAANYERRNYTTISVFHKLNQSGDNAEQHDAGDTANLASSSKPVDDVIRDKKPRFQDWPRYYKAETHERFHQMFPETEPDLRDSRRTVRRVVFGGYRSHVLR
eukprot:gene12829-14145_t